MEKTKVEGSNGVVREVIEIGTVTIPEGVSGYPVLKRVGEEYVVSLQRTIGLSPEAQAKRDAKLSLEREAVEKRKVERLAKAEERKAEQKARSDAWNKKQIDALAKAERELVERKKKLGVQ